MRYTPQFQLFELVQNMATGKLFVVTEVRYVACKNWLGKIKKYEFQYDGISEQKIKQVLTAHDAWEKGVLADPQLFFSKK